MQINDIHTLADLYVAINSGTKIAYLPFFSHKPKTDAIDESCLSQWYPANFTVDGALLRNPSQE